MSKNASDNVHWICTIPTDEKQKLNLAEFYKICPTTSDSPADLHSCYESNRTCLNFEKKGPYPFQLYSPLEEESKCTALDVLFNDPVTVAEIRFQNYYTAYVHILQKAETNRNWEPVIEHTQLMPHPHFETDSRAYFTFKPKPGSEWCAVTELRFIFRQPSPNWKQFYIENLQIYGQPRSEPECKNYLTYLIKKTDQALRMEHKQESKHGSSVPFYIGTYGYEIDKLPKF